MTETPNTIGRRGRLTDEEIAKAAPRKSGGKDVIIGIFVLVGLLSFVAILFLLTDPATMRGRYMLVTTVADAGGVRRGDPVQMRGVIIGRINNFEMMTDGRVAVRMELEGEWRIPLGSRAKLGASGLFGGRTMEIMPTDVGGFHAPFDTLPGSDGGAGLAGSVDELSAKATSVLSGLEKLLDDSTVVSAQGSVGELETLLTELSEVVAEQRSTLRSLTASLSRSADQVEEATPDARRAIARADSAMAVLAQTGENLDKAAVSLRTLLERIDRGEGTLGKLATDQALYDNVNRAAESLATLLDDVRANPKKYINVSVF
ncbi:MAG TPA: MlaD family protein [Longimicrobiales bacterium]|nr:MlaD family protein [Longimicrobiales bacterium]